MRVKTSKSPKLREFKCVICGNTFYNRFSPAEVLLGKGKVCSKECKIKHSSIVNRRGEFKKCLACGKEFWVRPSEIKKGSGKYCSRKCWSPTERGKAISIDGYYVISGIKVHRMIMEKHIGRKLLFSEIVHHINEDKFDNDIKNLKIVSRKEHNIIHKFLTKERRKKCADKLR